MDPNRLRLLIQLMRLGKGYSVPLSQLVQGIDIRFTLRPCLRVHHFDFLQPHAQILRLRPDDSLVSQQDRVRDVLFHQDVRRPQDFLVFSSGNTTRRGLFCAL